MYYTHGNKFSSCGSHATTTIRIDHLFFAGYQQTLLRIMRQKVNDHHFRFPSELPQGKDGDGRNNKDKKENNSAK
jgi:hypothetical protein